MHGLACIILDDMIGRRRFYACRHSVLPRDAPRHPILEHFLVAAASGELLFGRCERGAALRAAGIRSCEDLVLIDSLRLVLIITNGVREGFI